VHRSSIVNNDAIVEIEMVGKSLYVLDIERIIPIHGSPGTLSDLERAMKMHRARERFSRASPKTLL
jgi:hypothetical protein